MGRRSTTNSSRRPAPERADHRRPHGGWRLGLYAERTRHAWWRQAGAKNIYVLHTVDRKLADSDSFVAILKKAGGVWFEGGRQFHLVDSYAGTKTEQAFNDVLARGG